jgi:hypothetical protein
VRADEASFVPVEGLHRIEAEAAIVGYRVDDRKH